MQKHVTDFDRTVAANIKRLRVERGLTQPRVAEVLGITYQSYQKLEGGRTSLRARSIWAIAELFSVPATQIVEGADFQLNNGDRIAEVAARMAKMGEQDASAVVSYAYHLKDNPMAHVPGLSDHGDKKMTSDEILKLDLVIQGVKEAMDDPETDVTEWEQNFVMDQEARKQEWGDRMRMSEKQWAIIDRIYDKVVKP